MRLRSVTVGGSQSFPVRAASVLRAGEFAARAKEAFEAEGYGVDTLRLATQPISAIVGDRGADVAVEFAIELERHASGAGIDYCSVGPIIALENPQAELLINQIPALIGSTDQVFVSVMGATTRSGINLTALRATAASLLQLSVGDEQGVNARRFTMSANVSAHGPFFPSAYHAGRGMGFSIAVEAADLAVDAFSDAKDLVAAAQGLRERLCEHGVVLERVAKNLVHGSEMKFYGTDISLAPFPEDDRSIGHAIERLGVGAYGGHGTLFASALITGVLSEMPLSKCGFSGLMIPMLEDSVMARRHSQGVYGIDDLLLYSAVCGAGLDTIPVPGDATVDQIASVYLDVCTLSVALGKPLTARLMPLAGKKAGMVAEFDFPYFAPTKVVKLGPASASLFGRGEWLGRLGQTLSHRR